MNRCDSSVRPPAVAVLRGYSRSAACSRSVGPVSSYLVMTWRNTASGEFAAVGGHKWEENLMATTARIDGLP